MINLDILSVFSCNGLQKAKLKIKFTDTVFDASRNHQGEVVVVDILGYLILFVSSSTRAKMSTRVEKRTRKFR